MKSPPPRRVSAVRVALLIVLKVALIVCLSSIAVWVFDDGWGAVLFVIFSSLIWPVTIALGLGALFAGGRRQFTRARIAALVIGAGAPFIALALGQIPAMYMRRDAGKRDAHRNIAAKEAQKRRAEEAKERFEARARARIDAMPAEAREAILTGPQRRYQEMVRIQTKELREQFASPQIVKAAGEWYLILENSQCVKMYGMTSDLDRRYDFGAHARGNLVGTAVDIRLSEDHADHYKPGVKTRATREYGGATDSRGDLFGDVCGLVFVDGHLINLDYCDPDRREVLVGYQEAYERGEL